MEKQSSGLLTKHEALGLCKVSGPCEIPDHSQPSSKAERGDSEGKETHCLEGGAADVTKLCC